MPRPRNDGTPADQPNRRRLNEFYVRQTKPRPHRYFDTWDEKSPGLILRIQPTGHRAWYYFYRLNGRSYWHHLGNASTVTLAEARKIVTELAARIARGENPAADRAAERNAGTFVELAVDYVERHAKKKNKSYRQAEKLVSRYLLPKWKKLKATEIKRRDVRAALDHIDAPVLANQVHAAASAIFSWAVEQDILQVNPARGIKRHAVKARERILTQTELRTFWPAFDQAPPIRSAALKLILLTGQRPGEISRMRREHIEQISDEGAWWHLPGAPDQNGWPGTKGKKDHKVWLSRAACAVLTKLKLGDDKPTGFVFGSPVHNLDETMRQICASLKAKNKVTPHDLRRTCGSTITELGFGRQAMDRILAHSDHSIGSIYDRHSYSNEDRHIMEAVGSHIMSVVAGKTDQVVVPFRK
jgi:integrase